MNTENTTAVRFGPVAVEPVDGPPDVAKGDGAVSWAGIAGYLRAFPGQWYRIYPVSGNIPIATNAAAHIKNHHGCEAVWRSGEVYARFGDDR